MEGWIKLHRQIMEWEWYDDANVFKIFIHFLLKANHEDRVWRGVLVRRGQFISSYGKLALETNTPEQTLRTAISKLKKGGELTHKSTNKYGLFEINNYDKYQDTNTLANTLVNSQLTNKPHSRATSTNNKQELKEIKKKENNTLAIASFSIFWNNYPKKVSKEAALKAWKKINPTEDLIAKINAALDRQRAKWDNPKFIPHASTWLNGKRWEDETITTSPAEAKQIVINGSGKELCLPTKIFRELQTECRIEERDGKFYIVESTI